MPRRPWWHHFDLIRGVTFSLQSLKEPEKILLKLSCTPCASKLILMCKNQCKAPSSRRSYCCHKSYKWQHYCVSFILITYFAIHYAYYQLDRCEHHWFYSFCIYCLVWLFHGWDTSLSLDSSMSSIIAFLIDFFCLTLTFLSDIQWGNWLG